MDVGMTVNLELHYCIIIEVKLSIVFKTVANYISV